MQEHIDAESLAGGRSLSIEQIQDIARQTLDILFYLQSLRPSVIHRDIKPENILLTAENQIYLVDFGFSRLCGDELAASSLMAGTLGFMPLELFHGQEPTPASDLYSLGATLIALSNGVPSTRMGDLLEDGVFKRDAFDAIPQPFAAWLRRMTARRVGDRFSDAQEALQGLQGLLLLFFGTFSCTAEVVLD